MNLAPCLHAPHAHLCSLLTQPDLVQRFKENLPLTPYDRKLFYVPGPEHTHGYVDYATYEQEQKEHLVDGKTAPKPTEQQP